MIRPALLPIDFVGDDAWRPRRAHLVGICGAGMRALAHLLDEAGWHISGSDALLAGKPTLSDRKCRAAAASVDTAVEMLIHSAAIADDHPELIHARRMRIPCFSYPAMLARLASERETIAIAGTHGKSTATAMLATVLRRSGHEPSVVGGARPLDRPAGGSFGRGALLVAEACEYRAHFRLLRPQMAAILAVEADHFDYYLDLADVERAFADFARRIEPAGLLVANADCPVVQRLAQNVACRAELIGIERQADWRAVDLASVHGRYRFTVRHGKRSFGRVSLRMPGRHNVLNALAAAALAHHAGAPADAIAAALSDFPGAQRRLETLAAREGVNRVDDYAHHPTEVRAALAAVREMYPGRRVWCVFQPHQHSRTAALLDPLAASLQNADKLAVAEIFSAREDNRWRDVVSAGSLAAAARRLGADVVGPHEPAEIRRHLDNHLRSDDVLVTLGAGDIGKLIHERDD